MTTSTADKRAQIDDLRRRMARIPGRLTEHESELSDRPQPRDIADDETTRRTDRSAPSTQADTIVPSTRADENSPARSTASPATSRNVLPAPGPLAELLPHRGLLRGTVTALTGSASILTALIAATTATGQHAAVIGYPRLGLLAAAEHGADLARCAWIPDPGDDPVEIAAVLLDGLSLIVVDLAGRAVAPTRARAVTARARAKGASLLIVDGRWPGVDLTVDSTVTGYTGLHHGHGRITGIELDVTATGRGARPRTGRLEVAGHGGAMIWTTRPERTAALRQAL